MNTMFDDAFDKACENIFGKEPGKPLKSPKLLYMFSSPGAGKSSTLKPIIEKEYPENEKPLIIEIDELKHFVPDTLSKKEKNKVINSWYNKIVERAINSGQNIIIFRLKDMVKYYKAVKTFKKAKEKGYSTEAVFMAVDKRKSRMGMVYRYENALKNMFEGKSDHTNYPRNPNFFYHYVFYKSLPVVAKLCETSPHVDKIKVFDRNGKLLAFNYKKMSMSSKISPLKAILKERSRSWTEEEKCEHKRQLGEVNKMMENRKVGKSYKIITRKLTQAR